MKLYLTLAVVFGIAAYFIGVKVFSTNEAKTVSFDELPTEVQNWFKMGKHVSIHGHQMFYIVKKCTNPELKEVPTFALIHGFPSSSYEYHKILDKLSAFGDVVLNDHIGFGFSDGPKENYTYALSEAAENILALWRHLGLKKAHVISHDMGDSILTEILARRHRGMLPQHFDNFFQSVTFTNGGMKFKMIKFRISQTVMMYKKLSNVFIPLIEGLGLREIFTKQQLKSIWSPTADPVQRDRDIDEMLILNIYTGADLNVKDTIFYLWDRYHFEFRWFAALEKLNIPSRFIWSDSDAVSPIAIPQSFQNMVPNFDLTIVKNLGHFWMLEDPDIWVKEVIKILDKSH